MRPRPRCACSRIRCSRPPRSFTTSTIARLRRRCSGWHEPSRWGSSPEQRSPKERPPAPAACILRPVAPRPLRRYSAPPLELPVTYPPPPPVRWTARGSPLPPPAVTASARTLSPNSTTATKLLPLVPYHRLVLG